jgi:organic radical activating enzyme
VAHSSFNQRLVNEIETIFNNHDLSEVVITGGEPFLYLGLEELVSKLTNKGTVIRIWSGLGVDPARFSREIKKLSKFSNVEIVISAETTGKLYELVRYGNTWDRLLQNISTLEQLSVDHSFYCTVTNLTLLGVEEFVSYVGNKKTVYSLCTDPSFLAVNVLDPANKQKLLDQLETLPEQLQSILIKDLVSEPTTQQQTDLKTYLTEFSNRRNIDLNFLPETFRQWAL